MIDEKADSRLVDKLNRFIQDIQKYQNYSQSQPVYQLIDKFYNDHFVIQYFSGLIGGKGRRANLYGLFIKLLNLKIQVSEVYSNLFVLLMSLLIVKKILVKKMS